MRNESYQVGYKAGEKETTKKFIKLLYEMLDNYDEDRPWRLEVRITRSQLRTLAAQSDIDIGEFL